MTSKLTREERVQSLYGLKIGQVLNPSDIESIKMLASMALAAMDSEPVAYIDKQWTLVYYVPPMSMGLKIGDKLYRHAQPAQVAYSDFEEFWSAYIHPLAQDDELKDFAWDIWNSCRAAMLHAGNSPAIPDGYVMVPKVPSQAHLNSIAMRYRHDFYLLNDAQKDSALATARQMYEECSGQGFYTLPAGPQEVR